MRITPILAAALFASAPAAAEPGLKLSESAYVDALRESSDAANERMEAAHEELADLPPVAYFESFRLEGLAALREAREEVEEIAPRPDDHGMRAQTIAMYTVVEQIFAESLPEAFELFSRERVKNADLARLEALMRHMEDAPRWAYERLARAQRTYVEAKGWRYVEASEGKAKAEEPSFVAPGIPPAGSRLDGEVHVGFAIRYHNEALELRSALVSSANRLMSALNADAASIEAARAQELEQVRSVLALAQKLEPWQGDASLRDGLLQCGHGLERMLERPVRAFGRAVAKGFASQKQVDAANALIAEINQAAEAAMHVADDAERRFAERWAFAAYEVWEAAQPKRRPGAPPRDPRGEGDGERPVVPEPAGPPARARGAARPALCVG